MQAVLEAAEGIRTLDLLHGKQGLLFPLSADIPCKPAGSRGLSVGRDSTAFTGNSRGFGHPMGTRALRLCLPEDKRRCSEAGAGRIGTGSVVVGPTIDQTMELMSEALVG
jgi:hypothetical protein